MKVIKSMFIIMICLACVQFSIANPLNSSTTETKTMMVTTTSNSSNSVDLYIKKATTEKLIIHLLDANGKVLYFKKMKNEKDFHKRFSLENLTDGTYFFSIEPAQAEKIVKTFVLKNRSVDLERSKKVVLVKKAEKPSTVFIESFDQQSIYFSCSNNSEQRKTLRLTDANGHLILFVKINKGESCAKKIDLSQLPDGNYHLHLDGDSKHQIDLQNGKVTLKNQMPRA